MRAFCSQLQLFQCTTHTQIPLQELGSLLPESKRQCRKRCGCKKKPLFHFPTSLNIFLRSLGRNQPSTTLCTIASWAQSHQLPPCLGSPWRAEGPVLAAPSLVSAGHRVATRGWKPTPPPNNAQWGPCKGQPRAVRPLAVSLPGLWWAQPSPCAPPDKQVLPTACSILLWSMLQTRAIPEC
ncbi:hypothetical protein Nmel_010266 [Mimus melanotis]